LLFYHFHHFLDFYFSFCYHIVVKFILEVMFMVYRNKTEEGELDGKE